MRAAVVREAGKPPVYGEFRDPVAGDGEVIVATSAAAMSPLVKSRAAGAHYSFRTEPPFVVGVDGVGRLADGRRVYFFLPKAPFGAMAERVAIDAAKCVAVPDGLDDVSAAALANPGMSSWAALRERAKFRAGETVLINGATGSSGRLAVQIARHLGAARIIVTGRNRAVLESLGADVAIPLVTEDEALERAVIAQYEGGHIDVVLDYLWGASAEQIIVATAKGAADGMPVRFVNIGTTTGANITLPGTALRSVALELMGSGIGSVPPDALMRVIGEVFEAAVAGSFQIECRAVPLTEVTSAWDASSDGSRVVFTI
jgi:NADPH:quinone reductase-like Zn-dependent oxidoreductase